jgi:hypothetical protein
MYKIPLTTVTSNSAQDPDANFQSMFKIALDAYEKKTNTALDKHPLAVKLQACSSPSDILAILQNKVKEFEQSRRSDEKLSRWLNPTIDVLYAFSTTLGVLSTAFVSPIKSTSTSATLIPISQAFSPATLVFSGIGVLLSVSKLIDPSVEAILQLSLFRRPRMSETANVPSSISSNVSRTFSGASNPTPRSRRRRQ